MTKLCNNAVYAFRHLNSLKMAINNSRNMWQCFLFLVCVTCWLYYYYIILYYLISYHVMSCYIIYIISYHVRSCYIIYHIILCYIISYHIISCHVISYHILYCTTVYYIISYHIMSCYIISYIILYYSILYYLISYHVMSCYIISYIILYMFCVYRLHGRCIILKEENYFLQNVVMRDTNTAKLIRPAGVVIYTLFPCICIRFQRPLAGEAHRSETAWDVQFGTLPF